MHAANTNINDQYIQNVWIDILVWIFIVTSLSQIGMAIRMWSMNLFHRLISLVILCVGLGFGSRVAVLVLNNFS